MTAAAENLYFERAAELRDTIDAITRVVERQRIVSGHLEDHDFIGSRVMTGSRAYRCFHTQRQTHRPRVLCTYRHAG